LDPVTTDVIGELMIKTAKRHAVTSIVVTHDMQSAFKIANTISMLYEGKIIFSGKPDAFRNSNNPIIRQFVRGEARGPITNTESEDVARLSSTLIDRSLILRKIAQMDRERQE